MPIYLNDLPLPDYLVELIDHGKWGGRSRVGIETPEMIRAIERVFEDEDVDAPLLYSLEMIRLESKEWLTCDDSEQELFHLNVMDPRQSLLIGTIQQDCPIVLDYQESCNQPKVCYFTTWKPDQPHQWKEIASTFEDFASRLGL